MTVTAGGGPVTGYVTEPLVEPEVDQAWTSDRQLDRLAPLAESLQHRSGVYDRWRRHQLAAARPDQEPFSRADLSLLDDLRGVHFGRLAAASNRLRQVGTAAARCAESAAVTRAALAHGWRGAASRPMLQHVDELARGAQDCAARCEALGLELEIAVIGTVAPVITSAVEEILRRSRGLEHTEGRPAGPLWEQRIAELERSALGSAVPGTGGSAEPHQAWRAELDTLVIDYDAVVGLFRAMLTAARTAVTGIYLAVNRAIASFDPPPFSVTPFPAGPTSPDVPGPGAVPARDPHGLNVPAGADPGTVPAPVATTLMSAGPAGAGEPAAGSSFADTGGAGADAVSAPGTPDSGSAVLGSLPESRTSGPGAATLGSLPDGHPESGHPGDGDAGAWGSSAVVPMAGAGGSTGADDPPRTGRHWAGSAASDQERDASWQRVRALLGEQGASTPAQPGPGPR